MIYDLQKASILKRISAWLLDFVLLCVLTAGIAAVISSVVRYESYGDSLEEHYSHYEKQYGVEFNITEEEYNALSEDARNRYDEAYEALIADQEAMYNYNMLINLTLLIVSLSILVSYLMLEFMMPLVLGNGQTIGKKVFGIALMRTNGVRVNGVCMFIRTLLGKYTLETMIPVLMVIMLMFNLIGLSGTVVILGIGLIQLVMVCVTQTNALIHDRLADTVAVDMASQMIFDTEEELLAYKKRVSAEYAEKQPYF